MAPVALALHLAVAAPGLAPPSPPLDSGTFRGGELAMASVGALAGDAAVIAAGWLTLQAFAAGTFSPTADNFRRAAYALGVAALVLPPLGAVLLSRWTGRAPAAGRVWKALLLAAAGQLTALGAGWLAAPHFWVALPVQVVAVSLGTSLGLHWGRPSPAVRGEARPALDAGREEGGLPDAPAGEAPQAALFVPICPDA